MKPLDLQVGIQNSYEAARSEAVRLEKPHAIGQVANEDARREQIARDESVIPPESKNLQEDLFMEHEYESPDYANAGGSGKKENKGKKREKPAVVLEEKAEEKPADEKPEAGFSTYA